MKSLKSNKDLVFFTLAWVLTLNGSTILLEWIGELIVSLELMTTSAPVLPVVGLSLQILLNILAALFGYLALSDKKLHAMSVVVIAVNTLLVVNNLAMFLYAVLSGKFSF
jgi:hypothetical protein